VSRTIIALIALTHCASLAGFAVEARAQMIPLQDVREVSSDASVQGASDAQFLYPSAPFAYFNANTGVYVENPDPMGPGSCSADAFQISQFFPAGISASGGAGGSWNVLPGSYSALSYVNFKFRIDTCFQYQLDAWLEPGDLGERRLAVGPSGTGLAYEDVQVSELHTTGRLPAGEYELEGKSYIISSEETTNGPVYTIFWVVTPCLTTLISSHPADQSVQCGANPTFTVVPTAPTPPGLTYQWRRNLVPLQNGAQVSGVATPTLTLTNVCSGDAGYYDVVLTGEGVSEPSRLARLTVGAPAGVGGGTTGSPAFTIELAGPNPFNGPTSFRYAASVPRDARISIHDITGARVRLLLDGGLYGSGTLTWDGTTDAGERAPAGIYFLRVDAEGMHQSRRLVLVR